MSNIEKFVQPCLLFLGCCALLLIDYCVQSHAILYIADSAIVFAGVLYYSVFLRNYVYNTYLNSCELGKLIVLYKEMKIKKNTHKDILRHMKILEYAIEVGDYATGQNELFFLKSQYNTLYLKDKEMVSAYESMILHHQTLVEYFYERRETPAGKKFYKKLKMRNRIGQTTYFKVCFSYWNVFATSINNQFIVFNLIIY